MQVMNKYTDLETMPCHVEHLPDGICSVTFTMPESQINSFVLMLSSLAGLFRGLGWKAKTNIDAIHARNMEKQETKNLLIQEFEKATVASFNDFMETAKTPPEALSLTVANIKCRYEFASYDIIKKCLIKNKCLKNTGFYKKR